MEQETTTQAPTQPQNQLAVPIAIVIAGMFVAGAIIFSNGNGGNAAPQVAQNEQQPQQENITIAEALEIAAIQPDDHIRGNRDAEVIILEFSDTECPFCKRFHTTMKQIIDTYPPNEVAWVYRHFPIPQLHPTAAREAEATECANELGGSEGFWNYTDQVYEQTPDRAALTDEDLYRIAGEVGLPVPQFTECLNSGKYAAEVQKDIENGRQLGANGTPYSLAISGDRIVPINGAQSFEVVQGIIDSFLNQ